jgi:hypothetical protein
MLIELLAVWPVKQTGMLVGLPLWHFSTLRLSTAHLLVVDGREVGEVLA